MIITVLPFINFCKACCILYSFSGSAKAVASSNTKIGEFRKIALAIQIRCASPPERKTPLSPTIVSYPLGRLRIKYHIGQLEQLV